MTTERSSPPPDAVRLLAAIGQAVIVFDLDNHVTHWNPAAEQLYGWTAEEAIGSDVRTLIVPLELDQSTESILAQLQEGVSWSGSFTVQCKAKTAFRVHFLSRPVFDEDGAVTAVVAVADQLDAVVRPLLVHSADAVIVVGLDGLLQFVSPAITHLFGWDPVALVGQPALGLVHPDDEPLLKAALDPVGRSVEPGRLELRVQTGDGAWRWAEATVTDLRADPSVRGIVINLSDITDKRAASERLTQLALHDPLTRMPNRTLMVDRIQHAHSRRGQDGALLLVDLDGLREVNHRFGHAAGDKLLRLMSTRLSAALPTHDTCGRIGGEEFLILAESVIGASEAVEYAERLQVVLGQPVLLNGTSVTLTCSVGITLLGGRHRSHELLREAVAATYDAKRSGFGRHALFDSLGTQSEGRGGLLGRLTAALSSDELVVHYQPIVDLGNRQVLAVEALVRWQHPKQGLLSADMFLDAAESSDLIHEIGAFVLRRACQQVVSWPGEELDLAVNISARQLADSALVEVVADALASAGLAPERLVLELTETALMQDLTTALAVLNACRDCGIRVSIDDFGTGFAGFGYLRDLPVDEIKIDRSFVSGLGGQGFDAAIVGAILHMAHGLGLRTTGEGVETERQAKMLTDLGCHLAQGFLWSPAVPGRPTLPLRPNLPILPLAPNPALGPTPPIRPAPG